MDVKLVQSLKASSPMKTREEGKSIFARLVHPMNPLMWVQVEGMETETKFVHPLQPSIDTQEAGKESETKLSFPEIPEKLPLLPTATTGKEYPL